MLVDNEEAGRRERGRRRRRLRRCGIGSMAFRRLRGLALSLSGFALVRYVRPPHGSSSGGRSCVGFAIQPRETAAERHNDGGPRARLSSAHRPFSAVEAIETRGRRALETSLGRVRLARSVSPSFVGTDKDVYPGPVMARRANGA